MENPKKSIFSKSWVQSLSGIIVVVLIIVGVLVFKSISSYIKIDNGNITSPIISVSPEIPGYLIDVYVSVGERVVSGQALAQVGTETLTAKTNGIIIFVNNVPGQYFSYANSVIKMIDPKEFRLVGTIKEDAGFSDIKIGDTAVFTLDAFPNKEFLGIVDEIAETSKDSSVVFSISDKRELKDFTIKIKYDVTNNPEIKNGMSAKIKVYTK